MASYFNVYLAALCCMIVIGWALKEEFARRVAQRRTAQKMTQATNFFNPYCHNFTRVAIGIPPVRVADPAFNVTQVVTLMRQAAEHKGLLVVFPELGRRPIPAKTVLHHAHDSRVTRVYC